MAFLENSMVQDAVVRNLEIIGEASNNVARHSLSSLPPTRNCLWHMPTRCVTQWPTATSKWTWKSPGRRSTMIFLGYIARCNRRLKACRVKTTTTQLGCSPEPRADMAFLLAFLLYPHGGTVIEVVYRPQFLRHHE